MVGITKKKDKRQVILQFRNIGIVQKTEETRLGSQGISDAPSAIQVNEQLGLQKRQDWDHKAYHDAPSAI